MSEQTSQDLPEVCPSCGASVRSDVPWCTQCYASLRPPPDAESEPEPRTSSAGDPGAEATRESGDPADDTLAGSRATDPAEVERVAEQMLAQLAVDRDEVRGLASRLPDTPGARALLIALVILGVTAVIVLLMFLVGSLL